ncbi:MAG: arginase family protein [Bacteroidales bacterium]|nr:arginase family protein [Candidatus Scybalocola fimicaballi]
MEDIKGYFRKPEVEDLPLHYIDDASDLSSFISSHSIDSTDDFDVAIIGIPSAWGSQKYNPSTADAPDAVRKYLYRLCGDFRNVKIVDFGNINVQNGQSPATPIADVVSILVEAGKKVVIIGGGDSCNLPIVKGMSQSIGKINMVKIDSLLTLSGMNEIETSGGLLLNFDEIEKIKQVDCIDVLGYQTYLCSDDRIARADDQKICFTRLAMVQDNVQNIEPLLRDNDFFSISARVVRNSDMPSCVAMPNGLYGEEACHLAKLAGLSDRSSVFYISDVYAQNETSLALSAQIVWHYLHGIDHRYNDYPTNDIRNYRKSILFDTRTNTEVKFYNNPLNGRWWVEIPGRDTSRIVSCKESDYEAMAKREVPEIWFRHFMR